MADAPDGGMTFRRPWHSGLVRLLLVGLAVAGVVALVSLSDSSPSGKERAAANRERLRKLRAEQVRLEAARRRDPAVRRETARMRAEQRPHFGSAAAAWPGTRAGQQRLVRALDQAITRGAIRRWRAHELNARVHRTVCVHLVRPNVRHPPPPPLTATEAGYECTAVTTSLPATSRSYAGIIGFPFWARMNFKTGRFAWCKVSLQPSEGGIGGTAGDGPPEPACDRRPA